MTDATISVDAQCPHCSRWVPRNFKAIRAHVAICPALAMVAPQASCQGCEQLQAQLAVLRQDNEAHIERCYKAEAQLAALQREHAAVVARVVELEANAGKLPKEPPLGLLVSMALRQDHGLGVPGYYDNMPFAAVSVSHARRLQCALDSMRQVYEEVSGHGFWSPENECEYVAMHKAALAQPDAARPAGERE